ncbi:stage II sporulation protein R [Paenibacillus sp. FSL R7-0331]|uniref:stage II sporulation protein R n=1 Tax=Paenibacillus sp. FSL R7-0331 TaxID=1536773 RepID=UPI0004F8E2BA|nr:stage II sporulation protein R [Paenibacillus sp. FSL R7-0331]AIQ55202.1 stage II sporulation protein R [Paenibacillus sp. FSL R7-0331]
MRVTFKHTAILFSFLMVLMMVWEGQKSDAAVAESAIPQQSIRLRILANSDGTADQLVKRQIRDAIVEQMNQWVSGLEDPQSLEQARTLIRSHLPELNELVASELEKRGIGYDYKVELGVVPFPTKLYGGTVYPAGEYEAVRVTLGAGKGQNWWCVLFPPLCFIDAGTGDAAAKGAAVASAAGAEDSVQTGGADKAQTVSTAVDTAGTNAAGTDGEAPEVRFFLWDMLQNLWDWISGLWA